MLAVFSSSVFGGGMRMMLAFFGHQALLVRGIDITDVEGPHVIVYSDATGTVRERE